ncbi:MULTISPECIES: ThiF family adenylyltransferase [Rhodanobacter]|uniref:ThiF family adenylyltransferase n=1 Tax=Rhodanobacter TaxID=75309 RepID=UPI00040882E9|nr:MULTISPECIES: ThiF family adenylyltransferase [Rhodanobacter]TAN18944.1 MAG: HesA/MoeB/ThiF family protein [Rhodanobacter sp.]UJJ55536.1 ThiF family adenylyltransferase [Rhodanobacter thiooxydans]
MSARHATQMRLPGVGADGQARLADARVLVVGAGGLGCALLPLLAGAGVGVLSVIDPDVVELGNLHRQTLYRMGDIGRPKVEAAAAALAALNPEVRIETLHRPLTPAAAPALVAAADVVVDAADQFAVSYLLSDACLAARRPLVSASAVGMAGYAGVFCGDVPSYRAVFPQWPATAGDCASAGVLGPVVAMIGALQAQLVLALLLDLPSPPRGRLFRWDGRDFASFDFRDAPEPQTAWPLLDPVQLAADDVVVDLRGLDEAPQSPVPRALRATNETLPALWPQLAAAPRVVLACRSGLRAARAAAWLQSQGCTRLALIAFSASHAG